MTKPSEVAILSRVIQPDRPGLPAAVARLVLRWEFSPEDRARMSALLEKAKAGTLSRAEKREAEAYERVGHLLSILKAKARSTLARKASAS